MHEAGISGASSTTCYKFQFPYVPSSHRIRNHHFLFYFSFVLTRLRCFFKVKSEISQVTSNVAIPDEDVISRDLKQTTIEI